MESPGNGQVSRDDSDFALDWLFQSRRIQVAGLIVSRLSPEYSHWSATHSLESWMRDHGAPGISGVDTRALTKRLRTQASMLGKIVTDGRETEGTGKFLAGFDIASTLLHWPLDGLHA